ncbi:MAG: outer membrane lipoprotein chaperone LolA [Nitrospinaceae bacterium]|nr:outer membrane lipoprotein chaperone LolA [Nitrospinaceae bacterium]NIR53243.1 outer membrane lipoprotein chaperone LolA [Nitrospinaceae bacterium]NIS83641.1 outer membrane lipoprotein chaperone LolA [Nitrospinaceae bacterium]NIT80432.1 outer membrane lipoprotein chaperone LolA [Nitrospinaceae bacterium]NIU42770.1 outer membrane lipoprotein chaperone LolA [Nitrospinaceae bacterium]
MKILNSFLILVSAGCLILPGRALALDNMAIVDSIQKQFDATHSFQAKFVQKSYLKILGQSQRAEGRVSILKPGKMKWDYKAPDRQILISNEQALWLYLPEERQVTKMKVQSIYSSNTPALFLAGRGKLTKSFNIGKVTEEGGHYVVQLLPRKKNQNLSQLVLLAKKNNFQITGSRVYDNLGNKTEMLFTEIQANPNLGRSFFQFQIPKGVELIDLTSME